MNAIETTIVDDGVRSAVYRMAKRQVDLGAKNVNLTPIELAIFGSKGGIYHAIVSRMIDEMGFPRIKRAMQKSHVQINAVSTLKVLWFAPHKVEIDPQGVREVQP